MSGDLQGIGMTSQRARDRLVERLQAVGIEDSGVLEVIGRIPRHIFVDEALASRAYDDTALPIGFGQTISQPYIVARMTEILLAAGPLSRVLEVGTGSGYQASILSQLVTEVYTVERVEALIRLARRRFQELRIRNIRIHHGDGALGWPSYAPYDGIIATAASTGLPESWLEQLTVGGRLVAPVAGGPDQALVVVTRTAEGYERELLEPVSFVPMRSGEHL